ncbi:hypothetical protein V2J09_002122 [Rumex salicifolius]
MASRRAKLGQLLLQSSEPTTTVDTSDHHSSATSTASPYNSNFATSSPWKSRSNSYSTSPFIKSPWSKLSPYHTKSPPTTTNHTLLGSLVREEGHVSSIACSPDFLYTGSESRTIRVWTRAHHLRDSGGFKSGSGLVKAILVNRKEGKVYTGHQDGKIRVWRRQSGSGDGHKQVGSLPTWKDYLRGAVDPGKYVQVTRHKRVLGVIMHFDAVSCIAFSSDAVGLMYSGSWDKTVKVWRVRDGKCLESIAAHKDAVNAVAVGFGGLVFTGAADGTVKVWRRELDGNNARHFYVQTLLDIKPNAVNSLAVSYGAGDGGDVLYSGSSDGLVNFWVWKEQLSYGGVLRGHKVAVLSVATAGRRLVLSGSADNTICVWRRELDGTHSFVDVLTGHTGPVKCLTVDHDEEDDEEDRRWIVYSGSFDKSVKIWRVHENPRAT